MVNNKDGLRLVLKKDFLSLLQELLGTIKTDNDNYNDHSDGCKRFLAAM